MTKIRVMSDLHLDFQNYDYVPEDEDILVLAGDIAEGIRGIAWIARKIPGNIPVLYVLGNHEYYNQNMKVLPGTIQKIIDDECPNVHLLDNNTFIFNDIKFIGSTLWTDYNLFESPEYCMRLAERSMNDFVCIKKNNKHHLHPIDCRTLFKKAKSFIYKELQNYSLKNIVISHHAPSIRSSGFQFRNDFLTSAFASNLEEFILENNIKMWIHGHCHTRSNYKIGNCDVICNPLGYPNENPSEYFPVILEV